MASDTVDELVTKLIEELDVLFPLNRGVSIQSECPIGLIGDDIEAVARNTSKTIGKPVIPVRCEGFRGVSQSLGHHIANDMIRDWVFPKADQGKKDGTLKFEGTPYDVAIIGDYNIRLVAIALAWNLTARLRSAIVARVRWLVSYCAHDAQTEIVSLLKRFAGTILVIEGPLRDPNNDQKTVITYKFETLTGAASCLFFEKGCLILKSVFYC
jgi:hypothetical protein